MSITDTFDQIVTSNDGRTFTPQEARNFQDMLNTMPTGDVHYNFINLETGAAVFY